MPLYEYQCDACGHRFEVIQKFSDAPIATCPKCAGSVQKLLSSPAIQFKGSGFYLTDYGRGTGKPESAGKGEKAKAEGAKDGGTSEGGKSSSGKTEGGKSEGGSKTDSGPSSSESKSSSSDATTAKPAASKSE